MKRFNRPLLVAGTAALIGLATTGATAIHAASDTSSTDPMSSLVTAIATKFNLSTTDVQGVFDEQRTEMDAKRAEETKTRLDQAVTDGKLTQAQEDLIVAKGAEEQTFRDSLKDKTETERRTAMDEHRKSLEEWATANSIPQEHIFMGGGGHGPGGPGRGDFGTPPTQSATKTAN